MMLAKQPYSYLVLRYVHDVVTLEALNVGLLVVSAEARFVSLLVTEDHRRASAVFDGFEPWTLAGTLATMVKSAERLALQWRDAEVVEPISGLEVAHLLMPADDSSLQWGDPGGGIASDLAYSARRLFERMVPQHAAPTGAERKLA